MKYFSLLLTLFLTSGVFGQFSGKAYYQSKTTVDMDGFGGREMSEEMKKMIAERMKNYLEKTYILTFNGDESIYKEEEKLETGAGSGGFGMMMGSFTPGEQYKDLSKQQIIQEQEFFGKQFLIIDSIPALDWQIEEDEFKQIGQYLAIKATAIKKIDENDFSMARRKGRDRDEKPETEGDSTDVAKDSSEEEDPMEQIEIPKEVIVTAWYTPQIPVQNGPSEYGGLPGLILELNVYRTTILCSKLVMNPKDAEKIEAPSKGQEVSREEYNKIVKEKVEEMRENFRGRGNGRGRRGF
jgi:GLPGLI family protein